MHRHGFFGTTTLIAIAALVVAGSFAGPLAAEPGSDDWPQYRGPQRDGVSPETGLLDQWPEAGPDLVWKVPIGNGFSAVSVAQGRVITMLADGGTEYTAAFDVETGRELWRAEMGPAFMGQFGNGPRSTPTVAGDRVFALGSAGLLAALAAEDGTVKWTVSLSRDLGAIRPQWGFSTSPLVDGDLVVTEAGSGAGKQVAAFDRQTGELRWTALDGNAGYSSPLALDVHGVHQLVFVTDDQVAGLSPKGETLWTHEFQGGIPMPVFVAPDRVFVSRLGDAGSVMLRIKPDGAEEVWSSNRMRNHFNTSVAFGDHIYGFDNTTFKCISADTGEQTWAKRGFGKGSLIVADDHLFILTERGQLVLAEADPERYTETGSVQALDGTTWTSPVLAGGRVYLRGMDEMLSFDTRISVTDNPRPRG